MTKMRRHPTQRASLRGAGAVGLVGFVEERLGFFDVGAETTLNVPYDFLRMGAGWRQGVVFLEVGMQILQAALEGGPVGFERCLDHDAGRSVMNGRESFAGERTRGATFADFRPPPSSVKPPARFPHDQRAFQQDIAHGHVGAGQAVEHGTHRGLADLTGWLMQGGERDRQEAGVGDVINAHDANILRNAVAELHEAVHELAGGAVVRADDAVGGGAVEEGLNLFL